MRRLFGRAADRDGRVRALEALADGTPPTDMVPAAAEPDRGGGSALAELVATKLLDGWLANRRQTLMPHTLNFQALDAAQASLLIGVMAAAAQADGRLDAVEERQLPLALERVGADAAATQALRAAMADPRPIGPLLDSVRAARLGSHAYAAALLAINRASRVNEAFLEYLAARLGLAPDVAASLGRRYRT